jgi:co-chaperonin GroES (HSP10)
MIFPGKITNTDPASGIIVLSNYKEKKKDGTVKNVSAYHWFDYGLNKKINSIRWMESPILPATK